MQDRRAARKGVLQAMERSSGGELGAAADG